MNIVVISQRNDNYCYELAENYMKNMEKKFLETYLMFFKL